MILFKTKMKEFYLGGLDLVILCKKLMNFMLVILKVNLRNGMPQNKISETCTAGAGSLLLEFGLLSRLLGDPIYESYARKANKVIWNLLAKQTGLLGMNILNIIITTNSF